VDDAIRVFRRRGDGGYGLLHPGETLEEMFVAATTAVVQVMVENLDALRSLTWSNTLIPQGLS
jgi:hypothetical protein